MLMILFSKVVPFLKYWKTGAGILLTLGFLVSFHLAKDRGEKLTIVEQTLEQERRTFQAQIKAIEKARQNDKERDNFRQSQSKKIKLAGGNPVALEPDLRDAYDLLRARRNAAASR